MLGKIRNIVLALVLMAVAPACNNATLSVGVGTSFGGYGGHGGPGWGHVSIGTSIPLGR